MEPQTTIIIILALCVVLLVIIFAVGVEVGESLQQRHRAPLRLGAA